jgi:uncharacterized protein (TIGR03437 family)
MRTRVFSFLVFAAALASAQSTPTIASGGIANGASFQAIPLAPGSLFSIFGSGLASQTASASTVPFSRQLGGVTVQFVNGSTTIDAPISYVQPGTGTTSQINAQVPWGLVTPGTSANVSMVVSNNGVPSVPTLVSIALAYTYNDAMFAWPTGSVQGLSTHPAAPGSLVIVYANGLGAVDQTIPDGAAPGAVLTNVSTQPVVLIGGVSAQVAFAGLSPQFPGVNQLNIIIPANAPTGSAVPIQVQVGGISSPATFTIAVGN